MLIDEINPDLAWGKRVPFMIDRYKPSLFTPEDNRMAMITMDNPFNIKLSERLLDKLIMRDKVCWGVYEEHISSTQFLLPFITFGEGYDLKILVLDVNIPRDSPVFSDKWLKYQSLVLARARCENEKKITSELSFSRFRVLAIPDSTHEIMKNYFIYAHNASDRYHKEYTAWLNKVIERVGLYEIVDGAKWIEELEG